MATAKTNRKKFSPLFFSQLKALWETGRFATVEEFHTYCKDTFKIYPSVRTIVNKITDEKWDRNKLKEETEQRLSSSYTDLFEREGMGDEAVVKRICEGIRAPERTIVAIVEFASKNGGTIDQETLAKFATAMNFDLRTAEGYLEQRHKLVGAYAATKHKMSGKIQFGDIEQMSPEEALAEHDRIHKNISSTKIIP